MENVSNNYLHTLLSNPSTNKTLISIISGVGVLKDIAVSTVELALFRKWKKSLFSTIDTPNL
jgi:hypothetical protein